MQSIIDNEDKCFICGSRVWLETHHIFGGQPNRKLSEKYGLKVKLCHNCHNEPPNGVHHNAERMLWLKKIGQTAFEQHYPELDFRAIFGKNYK